MLDLGYYLTTPIQHMEEYAIMFMDLKTCTPKNNIDYDSASKMTDKMNALQLNLSDRKKMTENTVKLKAIQSRYDAKENIQLVTPTRWFIREGWSDIMETRKVKERFVHLFSDTLMISSQSKKKQKEYFKMKALIPMTAIEIQNTVDTKKHQNGIELKRRDNKKAYIMYFKTKEDKLDWIRDINRAITFINESKINPLASGFYPSFISNLE